MTMKSDPSTWPMSGEDWSRRLTGLSINLMVRDVMACVPFHAEVLGATAVFANVDFAAFTFENVSWMLHADHTYDSHPIHRTLTADLDRGIGAEIRLHGRDPDAACEAADRLGCRIVERAASKGHGKREAFILDPEGYLWVPDVPA